MENPSELAPLAVGVKRSKTPIILASAAAVALVVSVGAFVGYRLLFGGPQPAERLPASVLAYLSVDLNPGFDQTRKLAELAEKMPQTGSAKDPKAALEKALNGLDLNGVDVKRDLTSWLGNRMAAAAWADGKHDMYGLLALESTDDKAATAGLDRIKESAKGKAGFTVHDGWALIAFGDKDAQAAADAVAAEAKTSPLSKSAKFTEARKWLEGDQFAVFFADYDGFSAMIRAEAPKELPEELFQLPTGTMILGVRAEDDGLSARFRGFGGKPKTDQPVTDAMGKLGALPSGTGAGLVARLPDGFSLTPFLLFGLPLGFASGPGELNELEPLTPAEQKEFDELTTKQLTGKLTKAEQKRLDELEQKMFPLGPEKELTPAEQKELDALIAKPNLTEAEQKRLNELLGVPDFGTPPGSEAWKELFDALAGGVVTLSMSMEGLKPAFHAVVELVKAPDAETAKRLNELSDKDVTVKLDGATLSVQSNASVGTGRLADDPLFRKASAGAGADAQIAAYVDLTRLVPAEHRTELGPYQAIFASVNGDSGIVRVLIG